MSKHVNKYFRKLPASIINKLQLCESSDIVVASVKKISIDDIKAEKYKHLNIFFKDGFVKFNKTILPNPKRGIYSKYNARGRVIKLTNLPKVKKYYSAEVPNYGDWSNGSHEISWDKMVYQKRYIFPKEICINISLLEHSNEFYMFKFTSDTILSKNQPDFMEELLYHCNILQENTGLCDVFNSDANDQEYINTLYVGWELLPPGTKNNDFVGKILGKFKHPSQEIIDTVNERYNFFYSLDIKNYIYGQNRFSEYFGASFENGYVLLENVRYGNAIFIFKKNWEELSKLSRIELQHLNLDEVVRIPHSSNWKKNVQKVLEEAS